MRDTTEEALHHFVTTQLIDNDMDRIARKINRLQLKIQQAEQQQQPIADAERQKWARKLEELLVVACSHLQQQRRDVQDCIDALEEDVKHASNTHSEDACALDHPDILRQCHCDQLPLGCHVAARVTRSHELWILARVIRYEPSNNTYSVEDVDTGENDSARTHHFVPRYHIIQLPAQFLQENEWIHYPMTHRVLAMYPNTTSFYRAQVRVPNPKGAPFVIVKFDDDDDEIGGAPDLKVPFHFVAPLPIDMNTKRH